MILDEKIETVPVAPSRVIPLASRSLNTETCCKPITRNVAPRNTSLKASLEYHTLTLGILAYVHSGQGNEAIKRVTKLHAILDSGLLTQDGIRDGVIEVSEPGSVFLS